MSYLIVCSLLVAFATLHSSEARPEYVETESFEVGMGVVATYTAPSNKRTTIDLLNADGQEVLHVDYRAGWNNWYDIIVLNSNLGNWGEEQYVHNFYKPPGSLMTIEVLALEDSFTIAINGEMVANYQYRTDVTTVKRVRFTTESDSKVKLLGFSFS